MHSSRVAAANEAERSTLTMNTVDSRARCQGHGHNRLPPDSCTLNVLLKHGLAALQNDIENGFTTLSRAELVNEHESIMSSSSHREEHPESIMAHPTCTSTCAKQFRSWMVPTGNTHFFAHQVFLTPLTSFPDSSLSRPTVQLANSASDLCTHMSKTVGQVRLVGWTAL